jgi:ATP-binding cassette subfamily F protein uup
MIEWLESYFSKENITCLWLRTTAFPRACNEIIELDNGKYTNTKETTYYLEKKKNELHLKMRVSTKLKIYFVRIRVSPTKGKNNKSNSSGRFYDIKEKHKVVEKKIK